MANYKLAGECYLQMADYTNAIKYFDKAILKFKQSGELYKVDKSEYEHTMAVICNNRGICYFKTGDLINGIASADEGITYKADYHNNHFIKGIMLVKLGEKTKAIESFKLAAKYGNPNALNALSMVQ